MFALMTEQEDALRTALTNAGVKRGDRAYIHMVAGVVEDDQRNPMLCFCPAAILLDEYRNEGRPYHRKHWSHSSAFAMVNAPEVAERLRGFTGMAYLYGEMHSKGSLHFTVDTDAMQLFPLEELPLFLMSNPSTIPVAEPTDSNEEEDDTYEAVTLIPIPDEHCALRTSDGRPMAEYLLQEALTLSCQRPSCEPVCVS
ncbi:hypothetical protein COU77_00970 [Candidatus Peregrinibacteria bacterium CG10_big_fil_rev_8_21_14_0_10_49_16]|nr:MAG: hypothetical protein COW95_03315 [Candidatus Peregrinibacteria bacterium CG22_combo_CG10-13_8_21_14_all_49_11]PIR52327.1 MAG: hypothetical protein COU77_00970 [Candidatus Peregrinibacteria bacterium CG10_big_fil_rev_8_21_14_0_10_49_16]